MGLNRWEVLKCAPLGVNADIASILVLDPYTARDTMLTNFTPVQKYFRTFQLHMQEG